MPRGKPKVPREKKSVAVKVAVETPVQTMEATKREVAQLIEAQTMPIHPSVSAEPPEPTLAEEVDKFLSDREKFHARFEAEDDAEEAIRASRVDPEIAAMRAAGLGDPEEEEEAPRPRREVKEDPEVAAFRMAERRRKQEAAERFEAQQKVPRNPDTGSRLGQKYKARRSPMKSGRRFAMPDVTQIDPALIRKDPDTGLSFVPEWVSMEDTLGKGNRSWARVEQKLSCGAEIIRDREGKPLVSGFGLAMQTHPDDYADYVVAKSPVGAYDPEALLEPVYGVERDAARKREGAIVVHRMAGHGRTRSREALERGEGDTRYLDE